MEPSPLMSSNTAHAAGGLRSLARGWATILAGMVIFVGMSILIQFTLARLLGPAQLGLYYLGESVLLLLVILALMGLENSVVREVAAYHATGDNQHEAGAVRSAFMLLFFSSLLFTGLFWISAQVIANNLFHQADLAPLLRILALSLPLVAFSSLVVAVAQAYQRMEIRALVERMLIPVAQFASILVAVHLLGRSAQSAAYALLAANLIGLLVSAVYLWKYFHKRLFAWTLPQATVTATRRGLLALALPFMLARFSERLNLQLETLLLGLLSTNAQVGVYTASLKATVPISLFLYSMNFILSPMVAGGFARQDAGQLSLQFQTATRWALTLALPVALVAILFSPEIMALLGPGFASYTWVLRVLAFGQLVNVATGSVGVFLAMTRYQNLNLLNILLMLAISLGLDLLLIPRYGALGAAAGAMIALIAVNLLALVQVYTKLRLQPYNRSFLKPLAAASIAAFLALLCRHWAAGMGDLLRLGISGVVLGIGYFVSLLALGLEVDDRRMLGFKKSE